MRINDWLALEEKYKFRFPEDFIPLYGEFEGTRVISDWGSDGLCEYFRLATPGEVEQWREGSVDSDLLPIIHAASGNFICLRLPYKPGDPTMWVEKEYETNTSASLGRLFGGVVRVLAAYMDAWSFDCSTNGEMEKAAALLRRSRQVLTDVRGLMDEKEREKLIHLRFWPRSGINSPVVSSRRVVIPSFARVCSGQFHIGESALRWAENDFGRILKEDPSFGAGHWGLGLTYSLSRKVADACREFSLVMEGDLRTAVPRIEYGYAHAYGGPVHANFLFAAQFLREHEAEYRSVSKNRAICAVLLGDGFNTEAAWLEGLRNAMQNGWYDEALPVAQSLLASYLSDEWFNDDVDTDLCFGTCTNALATIYAAAGLECRVTGAQK